MVFKRCFVYNPFTISLYLKTIVGGETTLIGKTSINISVFILDIMQFPVIEL